MSFIRSFASSVWAWFCRQPHKLWIGLVITMLIVKEQFPFSHFPMYSEFPDRTFYIYIADKEGKPLPLHTDYGIRTTMFKRIYNREITEMVNRANDSQKSTLSWSDRLLAKLKRTDSDAEELELHELTAEQLRPCGETALKWLVENDRRKKKKQKQLKGKEREPIQLVHVNIELENDQLVRKPVVVATY